MPATYRLSFNPIQYHPLEVMLVGDSITNLLQENCPQLETWAAAQSPAMSFVGPVSGTNFAHDGRDGWTTLNHYDSGSVHSGFSTSDQLPALLTTGGYEPHIVVIGLGTNDGPDTLEEIPTYVARQEAIADVVWAALPGAVVVLASMLPNGQSGGYEIYRDEYTAALSDLVDDLLLDGKKVIFLDLFTPLAPFDQDNFSDVTHPLGAYLDSSVEPLYRPALTAAAALYFT